MTERDGDVVSLGGEKWRFRLELTPDRVDGVFASKWVTPERELVQQDSQGIEIARRSGRFPGEDLGGRILRLAEHARPGSCQLVGTCQVPRQPEVEDHRTPIDDEHV